MMTKVWIGVGGFTQRRMKLTVRYQSSLFIFFGENLTIIFIGIQADLFLSNLGSPYMVSVERLGSSRAKGAIISSTYNMSTL